MSAPVRKPKPHQVPVTLAELVLDLERRMEVEEGGDSLSDVLLPGDEWLRVLGAAEDENEIELTAKQPSAPDGWATGEEIRRIEQMTAQLADAVGWGHLNGFDDLLQVVQGYVMALESELLAAGKEYRGVPVPAAVRAEPEQKKRSRSKKACTVCGESDGHTPAECALNENNLNEAGLEPEPPTIVETADKHRAEDCARRLNGAGWRRTAKKAREENSVIVCHHCGAGISDDTGGLSRVRGDPYLPDGTFCHQCRARLTENPREWDRHSEEPKKPAAKKPKAEKPPPKVKEPAQQTLDDAIAQAAHKTVIRGPRHKAKKFPLGTGPTERCTKCNRMQGAHAGNTCPPHAHGDHSDDYNSEGKLIEFAGTKQEAAA